LSTKASRIVVSMVCKPERGNTMKRDNQKEVTLATLKLKDMLGIGIGAGVNGTGNGSKSSKVASATKKAPNPAVDSHTITTPSKKKNGRSRKSKEHNHRQSKATPPSATPSSSSSMAHSPFKQNRAASKSGGGGVAVNQSLVKENERRGRKSKNTAAGARDKDEGYAQSAFQSPPDASTLPLPMFADSSSHSGGSVKSESKRPLKEGSNDILDPSLSIPGSNVEERGKVDQVAESQVRKIVEALASEYHSKAILNIEQKCTVGAATVSSGENDESGTVDQTEVVVGTQQPTNPTSVNIASLTSSPPALSSAPSNDKLSIRTQSEHQSYHAGTRTNHDQREQAIDPIAMLMNGQSYGTTNPAMTSSPHDSHYPLPGNGYQQQPPMIQHHPHAPQYITIQVQVPPILLPGRQMMVSAAPGYSIPIVVPEGVHPGMVLPVTIPAHSPSPEQMGGHMSPVMMPHGGMMHLNIGSPSHETFSHQEVRNTGHQYPQPQFGSPQQQQKQRQFGSPQQQKKQSNGPEPGSWAARAAAPPSNEVLKGWKGVGNN